MTKAAFNNNKFVDTSKILLTFKEETSELLHFEHGNGNGYFGN